MHHFSLPITQFSLLWWTFLIFYDESRWCKFVSEITESNLTSHCYVQETNK